jgi:hypothetical protein
MAAWGIIKIPVVGAAAFIALLSITTHGNHPFLRERVKCSKARRVWRQACAETRPPYSGERQKGLWFRVVLSAFYSVTVGKLSFLIALWIVAAGVCFLSLHAPYFGLPESGGEPA